MQYVYLQLICIFTINCVFIILLYAVNVIISLHTLNLSNSIQATMPGAANSPVVAFGGSYGGTSYFIILTFMIETL